MLVLETLRRHRGWRCIQLSQPEEIDRFRINEAGRETFSLLKELGMPDYKRTFKIWLRKFPRPIFIVCVDEKEILAWAYTEEWKDSANDGEPVYVLRAIEISEDIRGRRLGYRLLLLICNLTPGYLITKPINEDARRFFLRYGFIEKDDFDRDPIDLRTHPDYLVLPPFKKKKLLEDMDDYFVEDE